MAIKQEVKNTELIKSRLLTLPLHPDITKNDVTYICKIFIDCLDTAKNQL